MVAKKQRAKVDVDSTRHKDSRKNIPTAQTQRFANNAPAAPKIWERDTSLDPQLVWKGKDEQDQHPLEVPVVPIYIQEKIHPQALIEDVRRRGAAEQPTPQLDLFADFNGIDDFQKKIEFYQHDQHWSNRMILGDSLMAMTSLAEKEALKGKVQMIYIDPPYGIKFGSNWQVSTRKRDVRDGKAEDVAREPEVVKAFRDTWALGIHSYLTYLRDRFVAALELLTETGSIFVQIGDENVHLVRNVMDEVFGANNFASLIAFRKTSAVSSPMARVDVLGGVCDFLLWYTKDREKLRYRQLYFDKTVDTDSAGVYAWIERLDGVRQRMSSAERSHETPLPHGARVFRVDNVTSAGWSERLSQPIRLDGNSYVVGKDRHWATHPQGMKRLAQTGRILPAGKSLGYVRYIDDFPVYPIVSNWTDTGTGSFTDDKTYVVQTGTKVIERCMLMTTDAGDLVLDPTCGSGTTAYVAEQWGRRWITMDTSRVALALARTRLMSGKYPYYLLADSPEGSAKERDLAGIGEVAVAAPVYTLDVRKGFVYKRVPHITLKSIANNEEIDEIHARYEKEMEPRRARLNTLTKQSWEEWEIPREADKAWPSPAENVHADWWKLRRERQAEIDASIARRADTEVLVDQPYEDNKRVRVTGPFTVESLSPHRMLSDDEARPASEREAQRDGAAGKFEHMIIDNLRKAGVQNTRKEERLKFDQLEASAGAGYLHATGSYTDANGTVRRVAVSIGGEHSTVGSEQVKEAAKEAMKGAGFDLLLVCGFAYDAHASETAEEFSPNSDTTTDGFAVMEERMQFGKLAVVLVRMNPDLAMGDELLKKTGAGNLFMIFGEPDIAPLDPATGKIVAQPDGNIVVEIRGVDVYDPTTGQVRSSTTDDIACWFVDTNYDDESFFVRHAYFTGADEPYEKLKKALRAEIDEAAWSALYSTKSYPFAPPSTGKIAIKVINHYGDEVLKVYGV